MSTRLLPAAAGLLGFLAGYFAWTLLWDAFVAQVPAATYTVVRQSEAFGTIAGIAAAALTLTPGILLSLAVTGLVRRSGRTSTAQ